MTRANFAIARRHASGEAASLNMALKIKWNDDRVTTTVSAMLLVSRDNLLRGVTTDLIPLALATYRDDPDGFKANHPRRDREAARDPGPLAGTRHEASYRKLNDAADRLLERLKKSRRQFNSIAEMDNHIVSVLQPPLEPKRR